MNDDFRISRLLRLFHKSGGDGSLARAFMELPEGVRANLISQAAIEEGERPFLAYFRDDNEWVILTLRRIAWKYDDVFCSVEISELAQIHLPPGAETHKLDNCELEIVTNSGDVRRLRLEPGRPLAGFWNVLKMMIVQTEL